MEFMVKYQRVFALCGMINPILYALIWILGGILQPGYSHIRDDVSSLMALGAPNKLLFDIMHIIGVISMIIFSIGLILVMKELDVAIIGPTMFLIMSIIELIVGIFFPLNYGGEPTGVTGITHLVLVMLMGFISLGGMIAMWRGLRNVDEWKGYDIYSLITLILSLIFTVILIIAVGSEIMGLAERLVATTAGQYFIVLALKTFISSD